MKNKKNICKKTKMRMLCRQFARSGEVIESVSNDDGDGNKNGKKVIGLDSKTTTLPVEHAICTFLCRHCTTTTWNLIPIFMFYWGHKHTKGMSDPLFFHVFMTKSEINTFTFCTDIFGQFSYISILNYLVKETDWVEGKPSRSFLNISFQKLR